MTLMQNTAKWSSFRKNKIGSSDAPNIMGVGFHTPYQLWQIKRGEKEVQDNYWMQRGRELEKKALEAFEKETGLSFVNPVLTSKEYNWMIASFDGLSFDGSDAVEIKCPGEKDHESAKKGLIPKKYIPQLQHQMVVAELDRIYYFSYDGENGIILEEKRNEEYISKLIDKEKAFYDNLVCGIAPDLTDKDYIKKDDQEWLYLEKRWMSVNSSLKILKQEEEEIRKKLIELSNGQNSVGEKLRLTGYTHRGNVNYKIIPELIGVDVEQYRGKSSTRWRIASI